MHKPAVKVTAEKYDLPVLQPTAIKHGKLKDLLAPFEPDLIVTCAYGRILPEDVLNLPTHGAINIHASLLPKYRGASPINAAILEGDKEAGITIMEMSLGMDEGDILEQIKIPLTPTHTAEQLFDELGDLSAKAIVPFLDRFFAGEIEAVPQDPKKATYVKQLSREDGALDFSQSAEDIDRLVRGLYSWPGTHAFYQGKRFKILEGRPLKEQDLADLHLKQGKPGEIVHKKGRLIVQTGDGFYEILRYQPAGSRKLTAEEASHNLELGEILRQTADQK